MSKGRTLRLGTRRSALAWVQSSQVAGALRAAHPGLEVELVGIETRGDRVLDKPLSAIEGKEFFEQMWARIRERVTDMIFKVKMTGGTEVQAAPAGGPRMQMRHADATGAGFAGAAADTAAAMRAQGVEQKVETIRRETPRVGRNDPCPCGSGKKYKQCHGK